MPGQRRFAEWFARTFRTMGTDRSNEPQWLKGYSGQTTDALIALAEAYRIDSIVLAFEEGIHRKAARLGVPRLTTPERVVIAIEALEREVNHDGFDGLFRHRPEYVPFLDPSLRAIGLPAVADLTRSAIALLSVAEPLTPEAVQAAIYLEDQDRDHRLHEFDIAYNATAGDLAGPLFEYIKVNRDEITLP
jgi:hypothetical protein